MYVHYLPYYVFHRVIKGSSRSDVLDYFFSLPPSSIGAPDGGIELIAQRITAFVGIEIVDGELGGPSVGGEI